MATISHSNYFDKLLIPRQEAFESHEWDIDIPTTPSLNKTPEPVDFQPQPVTYTTVGSLVNPKATLQLATPNRIQREGANRKPLMSILANRPFDSIFQSCGPPTLRMSSSMRDNQQLSLSSSSMDKISSPNPELASNSTNLSSLSSSPQNLLIVTEEEERILRSQFNGRLPISSEKELITSLSLGSDPHQYNFRDIASTDLGNKTTEPMIKSQTHYQGLEKMQTLQRLSQFNNPIQEWARNKLSEFAVTKKQIHQKTSPTSPSPSSFDSFLLNRCKSYENPVKVSEVEDADFECSHLNYTNESSTKSNQLRRNNSLTTVNIKPSNYMSYPKCYPHPLTAGPPGQRNLNKVFIQQSNSNQNQQLHPYSATSYESQSNYQINNLQIRAKWCQQEPVLPWVGHTSSDLVDTIPVEDAAKYYPCAWPTGSTEMTGNHDLLSVVLTENQKTDQHFEELNNWFYSGQRRFAMIAAKFRTEDESNKRSLNDLRVKGQFNNLPQEIELKKLSVLDMNGKSLSECAAPLINSLLLTLLEYSDRQISNSRAGLSNYIETPTQYNDHKSQENSIYSADS